MALDPSDLPAEVLAFLREYHLATLTTLRPDLSPHVVAVGFSYDIDAQVARVITWAGSQKAINAARMEAAGQRAAVGQVDGGQMVEPRGAGAVGLRSRRCSCRGRGLRREVPRNRRSAMTAS